MNEQSGYRSPDKKRNSRSWSRVPLQYCLRAVAVKLCLAAGIATGVAAEPTLTILHTSEHHGQALPIEEPGRKSVGGMARRAALIAQMRKESKSVLLVDSGDILIGTAMSSYFRGEPDILAMNRMGYQAMAAGNHEFDYGLDHLSRLQALATFPILCSNLVGKTAELPCRVSTIVHIGNLSIGLLGLLGRHNFPDTFNREVVKLLDLRDPIETAREVAHRLRIEGADLIIAITHQDTIEDLVLLHQVPDLDVVIGGHTVGFDGLRTPGNAMPQAEATTPRAVFVKTERQGRTLGRLDLSLSRDLVDRPRIIFARATNLPVTEDVSPDIKVAGFLGNYAAKLEDESSRVLGESAVTLNGESEHVRTRETNLGNLLADLLRDEFGTDVAFVNGGQIRDSIPPGPVDLKRILRVLPFPSSIVTFTVTGLQLRQALENSVSLLPAPAGRFLQISGISVTFDPSVPVGSRVRIVLIGGRPLAESRLYSVATDAFIADGGDGYLMLTGAENRIERQIPVRDLLLHALQNGPLKASVEGRIRMLSGPDTVGRALPR